MNESMIPASMNGSHLLYAFSMFGLLVTFLLSLEWINRLAWRIWDDPKPWRSSTAMYRVIFMLLLLAGVLRSTGNMVYLMLYPDVAQETREMVATLDRFGDGISSIPMMVAWALASTGYFFIDWKHPGEVVSSGEWKHSKTLIRPLGNCVAILGISLTLAFMR